MKRTGSLRTEPKPLHERRLDRVAVDDLVSLFPIGVSFAIELGFFAVIRWLNRQEPEYWD